MERLFDPVRRKFVAATAEEMVRQQLLRRMMGELGYPKGLIAVEREIATLPHVGVGIDPERRVDVLCFACHIHPVHEVFPLLLVECKAEEVGFEAEMQAIGYNHWVRAPYICLAGKEGVRTLWFDPVRCEHVGVPFLPPFRELMDNVHKVMAP